MSDITEALDGTKEELRQVVLERVAAVQAKDPAPLAARQARDVVTFDVQPPLHSHGSGAVTEKTRRGSTATPAPSATRCTTCTSRSTVASASSSTTSVAP